MGVLVDCSQTPYSAVSSSQAPMTGIRLDTSSNHPTRTGNASYPRLRHTVPSDKHGRKREDHVEGRPTAEKSPSRDCVRVAGLYCSAALSVSDLHSTFRSQHAGLSMSISDRFSFACTNNETSARVHCTRTRVLENGKALPLV